MVDLDTNGMATHGQGVYTQTEDRSVAFVSEEFQPSGSGVNSGESYGAALAPLDRTPTPAGAIGTLLGGSANNGDLALSAQNDYPMPRSATTDRTSLSFKEQALKDGVDLGPLTGIFDGIQDNPYAAFGVSPPPTFYKMRVWNTVMSAFEYWVSEGSPSSANPSGQATLAGSLTVIAVKRPKDLVGQGPS